jgi:hypothetical protein
LTICNNQETNDEALEYLFQLLPFPILQTWWTWVKSLDIDDLNSGAQGLNPILTLAMVELHPSSSQFAPHAKSLRDTGGSWIFCLFMMFNYFFTNCNWIFENVFLRLFVHLRFWNFCSQSGLQLFFLDELLNFFFSLNVVEIFVHEVNLIFFSHGMLFKFFSCLLGEYWFLKFLSSKFGFCLL